MKKIGTKKDYKMLSGLPPSVIEKITETVDILNQYYGENRDIYKNLGGYVVLVEAEQDLWELEEILHEDMNNIISEFTDIIYWNGKPVYTSSQIQLSSDYAIVLLIPYRITPNSLLKQAGNG